MRVNILLAILAVLAIGCIVTIIFNASEFRAQCAAKGGVVIEIQCVKAEIIPIN